MTRLDHRLVKGGCERNGVFLFNVNWKSLPWAGKGSF